MLKIVYSPEAEAEFLEAIPFYSPPTSGGEDPFIATIDRHVREIALIPRRFPVAGRDVRRCVVRKYPFIIFFREYPDHIRILAIAHTSRHPDYWKRRI